MVLLGSGLQVSQECSSIFCRQVNGLCWLCDLYLRKFQRQSNETVLFCLYISGLCAFTNIINVAASGIVPVTVRNLSDIAAITNDNLTTQH